MRVSEVLARTTEHFKKKGINTARLDAELLLSHALNWPRIQLYSQFECPLNEQELSGCREVIKRRSEGEPVAYILGKKGFFKYDFEVNASVLIPRPESEGLVEKALEKFVRQEALQIIDLGTGSGCLGLSLLKEYPNATLTAVDISEAAIEVAKKNAERLGVAERVSWLDADVDLAELPMADLIVANPPYISPEDDRLDQSVKAFEPAPALFAGEDGLAKIFSWSLKAIGLLKKDGYYFCEFGLGQKERIQQFFDEQNVFENVIFHKDLAGHYRFFEVNHG